jgi:pterin-4a-carbinolamine dehydratase
MSTIPAKCKDLISAYAEHGWSFVVQRATDTGDHPYISTEARRGTDHVMITWHTRNTGTYRLFSCMVNKRDVTLAKAMGIVESSTA